MDRDQVGLSKAHGDWRQVGETSRQSPRLRICMPTSINLANSVFRCGLYEAQDVLSDIDDVDLIHLDPGQGFRFKEIWQRRLLYRDVSRRVIFLNPGVRKVRLTQEYDLFVVVCQSYWDLQYINAIDGWKDHCKTSVCWIDEMWASEIPRYKYWLHSLRRFDHVLVGYRNTVGPLSDAIGRPCRWLPGAVDALRFTPYPTPPPRIIDVYSIGRRWEGIHQVLLQATRSEKIFYIHDTFPSADAEPYDHQEHRGLFASVAKRSRYFIVAPGKMNDPNETAGQVEVGSRYYEGAAAGAVLIGQPPICDAFKEMFPWPDAVVEVKPDGSDVIPILASLASDPARLSAIGRRNAAEALMRHDWVYRWKELFRIAGIEPSTRFAARERRLTGLADLAAQDRPVWEPVL
jgi:hypothetical protein